MNKQECISKCIEYLQDPANHGHSMDIYLNNRSDEWKDCLSIGTDWLCGMLHIVAGIIDYGYVKIEDISGWDQISCSRIIEMFVKSYFSEVDLLEECDSYTVYTHLKGVY